MLLHMPDGWCAAEGRWRGQSISLLLEHIMQLRYPHLVTAGMAPVRAVILFLNTNPIAW
jgi:hypothetical protein